VLAFERSSSGAAPVSKDVRHDGEALMKHFVEELEWSKILIEVDCHDNPARKLEIIALFKRWQSDPFLDLTVEQKTFIEKTLEAVQ
jgi:hypothetical protein